MPRQNPASRSASRLTPPVSATSFEARLTRAQFASQSLPTQFEESNVRGAIDDEDSEHAHEVPSDAPPKGQTNYGAFNFDLNRKAEPSAHSREFRQDLLNFTENYSHSYRFSAATGEPNQAFRLEMNGTARKLQGLTRWQRPKKNQPLQQNYGVVRKEKADQDKLFAADMLLMLKNSETVNSPLHRAIKAKQPQIPASVPTTPRQEKDEGEEYSCGSCERLDDGGRGGIELLIKAFEVTEKEEAKKAKEAKKTASIAENDCPASSPQTPRPVRIKAVGSTLVHQELARKARDNLSSSQVTTPQMREQRVCQLKTPPYQSPSPVSATKTLRTPLPMKRPSKRCASDDVEQSDPSKRVRLPTLKSKESCNEAILTPPLSTQVSSPSSQSNPVVSATQEKVFKAAAPKMPRDPQAGPSASTLKERLRGERIKNLGFENPNGPCKYCADKGKTCYVLPDDLASRSNLMNKLQKMGIQLKDVVGKDNKGGFRCHDCTMSKRSGKVCNAGNPEERKTAFADKN